MPELNSYICASMKRRKIIPGPVLMVISILGITAFLLYWLIQSYDREKKSLAIKSEVTFRETIFHLQVKKLKLDGVKPIRDSLNDNVKLFVTAGEEQDKLKEIVSTVNVLRNKLKDSAVGGRKGKMVISVNKTQLSLKNDSTTFTKEIHGHLSGDHIINVLYGVDSLQEPIQVEEIDSVYNETLRKQKINIPFSIIRIDSSYSPADDLPNEVTIGFANPVTYRLALGNTFPYLIKRISLPILFSVILLGITILSFGLLYRNLQKQRRLSELKNEFISNITHELKTPIATVGVAIEALKNFNAIQDPQRTKEYLDISSNELQRLSLLVDKVLKLSMFEKKEIELKYESLNLKDIVDEVTASLRLQLEKNNARVSVTQNGDLNLQGDRLHLLSVVFNLLDNALKYSNGDSFIQIELNGDEQNVELSIKDNGIGIPQEYQNKVFEKFFRVPVGDTHNTKGYGLGLSYAAHVVKKHGGIISVDSQPGLGTRFIISLPKKT